MDPEQLIAHGRARFEHAAARRLLKEKYQAKMLFAHAGGMWQAGPDLICVLKACADTEAVLLDMYEQPVRVIVADLLTLAHQRWQEQMNGWLTEYQHSSNRR